MQIKHLIPLDIGITLPETRNEKQKYEMSDAEIITILLANKTPANKIIKKLVAPIKFLFSLFFSKQFSIYGFLIFHFSL